MVRRLLVTSIICGLTLQGIVFADTAGDSQSSDTDLTDRVVRQLSKSDRVIAPRVRVSTENGIVTLEASGLTSAQAFKILVEVRAVPGVTKVNNRLRVGM